MGKIDRFFNGVPSLFWPKVGSWALLVLVLAGNFDILGFHSPGKIVTDIEICTVWIMWTIIKAAEYVVDQLK